MTNNDYLSFHTDQVFGNYLINLDADMFKSIGLFFFFFFFFCGGGGGGLHMF